MTDKANNKETLLKVHKIFTAALKLYTRLLTLVLIFAISYLIYFLLNKYFNLSKFYQSILLNVNGMIGRWVTVSILFILGILLSLFRSKQQFWYGVFESAFALVSCYFVVTSINPKTEGLTIIVALGSTIYLIVRGVTNVIDGSKKNYWCKNLIFEISDTSKNVSVNSLNAMLKDKKTLVEILYKAAQFLIKYI